MEDLEPEPEENFVRYVFAKKNETYIYGLIDPRDSSLFWVGMTNSPELRYNQHAFEIVTNNPDKQKRIDDIKASGTQPGMVLIEKFNTRDEAAELEKNLIVFLSGVSSVNLKNIEHKPDKTWSFRTNLKAARRNEPWDAEQRVVLIRYYSQGMVCELIAAELQRTKTSIYLELIKAENANFIKIRDTDRVSVEEAHTKCKYPLRDLNAADIRDVTNLLPRVSSKYGNLNADHIKQQFINKYSEEKRNDHPNHKHRSPALYSDHERAVPLHHRPEFHPGGGSGRCGGGLSGDRSGRELPSALGQKWPYI